MSGASDPDISARDPLFSARRTAVEILAVSFVVLFQELTLIRWFPAQVRVLAYFPNLILIAAFFGLGVGCLRAHRRSLMWLWPTSLLTLVGVAVMLSRVAFTQRSVSEHLWLLYYDLPSDAPVVQAVQLPIILAYVLAAATFVPLGQLLAERLDRFRQHSSSLWGYSWDLAGSLAGVVAFAVLGHLGSFPWLWFLIFLAVGGAVFAGGIRARVFTLALALIVVAAVHHFERADAYSPYYALSKVDSPHGQGFTVLANGSLHQEATPLASSDPPQTDWAREVRRGYYFPYQMLEKPPRRVLVLGAGTGNDLSVLLDVGAEVIDAVEIDPVILAYGQQHPNSPYSSPRVRPINTDARSYLNHSDARYDLIVFATLDSLTRLSALSNVRLDNFVYTRECIQAARRHLSDDGGVVMYFGAATDYIDQRLFGLLAEVFDELPVVRTDYSFLFNRIYMVGPAFDHLPREPGAAELYFKDHLPRVEMPSDDWPYLYLGSRTISSFYLSLIGAFVLLSGTFVLLVSRRMRSSLSGGGVDVEMFLFGLAFLLIETTFVTAMNLVWGATWLTSAVVFGAVLLMILLATVIMQLAPLRWWVAAGGLVLSLCLTYMVPVRWLLVADPTFKLLLSVLYVGTPLFFASACFALRFKQRPAADVAFGWNLLGAVTGGLAEFLSMVVGLKALVLVALSAYLGAFLAREREQRRGAPTAGV